MSRRTIAEAVAFAVFMAMPAAQAASQIGVTSAVAPAARGTPLEAEPRVLRIGLDMNVGERVQTDAAGKAHLLFLDGSALSIGPNSEAVLDEYVYDPAARSGRIALSASRGLLRIVGGAISKTTPIQLRTPTATVGIRGGIAMASIGETTSAAFLFGSELTVSGSGGGGQTTDRPGFEITTNPNGTVNPPLPISARMLARIAAMEGGGAAGGPELGDADIAGSQIALFNSDAGLSEIEPAAGPPAPAAIPILPPLGEAVEASQQQMTNAAAGAAPGGQGGCQPADGPSCAGSSGGGSTGSPDPGGGSGGTPGGAGPDQTAGAGSGSSGSSGSFFTVDTQFPDNIFAPLSLPETFVGRAKRSTDPTAGTNDSIASDNIGLLGQPGVFDGKFDARATPTTRFRIAAPSRGFGVVAAAEDEPFGLATLFGSGSITSDLKFLYYYLQDTPSGDRVFAFAGVPTAAEGVPDGDAIHRYFLNIDGVRFSNLPFIDPVAGGASHTPEGYIVWANGAQNRAFGSGAVVIGGQGSSQVSAMTALMGNVFDDASGLPHILGFALGNRRVQSGGLRTLYWSPLSSSDADDGSDFFGAGANHFVLESSSADAFDALLARGGQRIVNGSATPYFANVPVTDGSAVAATRSSRTLTGFANALELDVDSAFNVVGAHHFGNASAADVSIATNNVTNGVFASFNLFDSNSGDDVLITFGGGGASSKSAFIDDSRFFAASQSVAIDGVPTGAGNLGLVTSSALRHEGFLPPGVTFCNCQYLTWGFFGGERFASAPAGPGLAHAELGTWVVGLPVSASQLVGIASQTASYSGHVIAGVMNGANVYQAAGSMTLSFTFGAGLYSFNGATISQFDGFMLTGANTAGPQFGGVEYTNVGQFTISGVKPGVGAVSAQVKGTFFGPGTPPQEAGGKIVLSGPGYKGAGTYAAKRP